ncbi:MAG: putative replicase protein [Leviviridae sp.]|nr:MAG: putative replicase protein [Leviviridae sp.]
MAKKMIFTNRKGHLGLFSDVSQQVHKKLMKHYVGSSDPHSADFNAYAYLCDSLLSKHPAKEGSESAERRAHLAIAKMMRSDASCLQVNNNGFTGNLEFLETSVDAFFHYASSLIGGLLHDWMDFALVESNFSGGASQGFRLREASPYKKFAGKATVTRDARPFAEFAVKQIPSWEEHLRKYYGDESEWFDEVVGNSVFTVPKNSEIDRAAAKEPDMNMYLQKGIGSFIRRRLRSRGIDLNDQTRNAELARIGSIDGSLATIDLSSASDSISERLVMELLPFDLYMYLDMIRSKVAKTPDGLHRWSLFSTMGNGFTFELESLIFWALARSVAVLHNRGDAVVSVYGDDIIVSSDIADAVIELLRVAGFTTNVEKTFTTGMFRESCGKHWYAGQDVTPLYIRKPVTDVTRLIVTANQLRRWQTNGSNSVSDPRLYSAWLWLKDLIDERLHGGKDVNSSESLATLDPPRSKLVIRKDTRKNFRVRDVNHRTGLRYDESAPLHPYSFEDGGRLVSYFHTNSEVSDTRVTTAYRIRKNEAWYVPVPYFPQEVGVGELS